MSTNIARLDWQRASEKARELKPTVRRVARASYAVSGSRGWQNVQFSTNGKHKFVFCTCEHGVKLSEGRARVAEGQQLPSACYHAAAAIVLHMWFCQLEASGEQVPVATVRDPREEEARAAARDRRARREQASRDAQQAARDREARSYLSSAPVMPVETLNGIQI